jgi:hypothetical protein
VIYPPLHAPNARVGLIAKPVLIGSVPDLIHLSVSRNTALWEFQIQHEGELPSELDQAVELESIQGHADQREDCEQNATQGIVQGFDRVSSTLLN